MNWKKKEEQLRLEEYLARTRPWKEDEMGFVNVTSTSSITLPTRHQLWNALGPEQQAYYQNIQALMMGQQQIVPSAYIMIGGITEIEIMKGGETRKALEKELDEHLVWAKERLAMA